MCVSTNIICISMCVRMVYSLFLLFFCYSKSVKFISFNGNDDVVNDDDGKLVNPCCEPWGQVLLLLFSFI